MAAAIFASAWTSRQSDPIESRSVLERRRQAVEDRFRGTEVTRPPHWGGYALLPRRLELWQGRDDRLHERVVFVRTAEGWSRTLLQP